MTDDIKLMSPCKVKLERIILKTPAKQLALSAELRKVINDRNILTVNSRKKILFELDQLNSKKQDDEKRNTLQEILTSELAYIKQIELIQEFFMKPIRQRQLLKINEYETLFGNINSIYRVNGALLEELKEDLMHLTSAFNKMAPFLKLYSEYAFNFRNAMDTLDELMNKNIDFSKFVQGQETRPEVQNKVSSLLIAPIQRIPRYCMLIKQVLDNTSKRDEDYNMLQETYAKLNDVAKHVDTAVQERQNSEVLLALATKVKQGKALVIKPGRRLIKQSRMKIYSANKQSTDIYMILFSDIIMFCNIRKIKIDQANSLKCMTIFPLRKCVVHQNKKMMIVIRCEQEVLIVYDEEGCSADWLTSLKKTLREYIENRSTLRKGSSSRRPAVRFDFEAYKDHGVSPGVPGLRKRRRFEEEEHLDEDENKGPQKTVPELKRTKMVECRRSIKSMIPKLMNKPRSILRGFRSKSTSAENEEAAMETDEETFDENVKMNQSAKKDALFPLRRHFLQKQRNDQAGSSTVTSSAPSSTELVTYAPNVFVFGRENNRKSLFSFSGILTGFSNSFKRVFGFR